MKAQLANAQGEIQKEESEGTVVENPTREVGERQGLDPVERAEMFEVLDQVQGGDPRFLAL